MSKLNPAKDKEFRREAILKKYGTWEEYEKQRKARTRETILKKCKTQEERTRKIRELEFKDFLKENKDDSKIGKDCMCQECGKVFKGNTVQQLWCRSCYLKETKIRRFGSLENYNKISSINNKKTKKERYGDENYNNREKAKETSLVHFGTSHPNQNPENMQRIKKTKFERYGDESYNNKEKIKETCLKKYGVISTACLPEVREKAEQTRQHRYQNKNYNNREKYKQTCLEKYDTPYFTNKNKRLNTMMKRYGVLYPFQSEEIREKIKETIQDKYGVDNISKTEESRERNRSRFLTNPPMRDLNNVEKMINTHMTRYGSMALKTQYKYENLFFDSSWELYYYLDLKDRNETFIYKPEKLEYRDKEGNVHFYFPDFKVNDKFIEIKGDHLLSPENILLDFKKNPMTEKTDFLKSIGVVILTSKDIKPIIEKIDNKFGKDFVRSFKVEKSNA